MFFFQNLSINLPPKKNNFSNLPDNDMMIICSLFPPYHAFISLIPLPPWMFIEFNDPEYWEYQ